MRRSLAVLLVLAVVLLVQVAPAFAADPLVPNRPAGAPAYTQAPLYDDPRFEPWSYTLEGQQWNSVGYISLYFWMNEILVAKAWLLQVSIRVVEYALRGNFFEPFLVRVEGLFTVLGNQLWTANGAPLVMAALSVAGLWALLLHLRGKASRGWATLGGTLLIVMLTTVLLTSGRPATTTGGRLAREMSAQVYGALDRPARNANGWGLLEQGGRRPVAGWTAALS